MPGVRSKKGAVQQVGSPTEIGATESRAIDAKTPFPQLLAIGSAPAATSICRDKTGSILRDFSFQGPDAVGEEAFALALEPDTYLTVAGLQLNSLKAKWSLGGTLYIIRKGPEITNENLGRTVD